MIWTGRIISGLVILFLLFDATIKIIRAQPAVEGTTRLGYPDSVVAPIGIMLLVCTILYAIPRTAVFGAVLLTGYLGGAVASNVRVSNPLFANTLFPVYVATLLWAALYMRDRSLRALLPYRSETKL